MSIRGLVLTILTVFIAGAGLSILVIGKKEPTRIDMVALNEVVKTIEGNWGRLDQVDYSFYEESFTVLDRSGLILYQSGWADQVGPATGSGHDADSAEVGSAMGSGHDAAVRTDTGEVVDDAGHEANPIGSGTDTGAADEAVRTGAGAVVADTDHVADPAVTAMATTAQAAAQPRDSLSAAVHDAIRNRDTIVDLAVQGDIVGKLIVHHQDIATVQQMKQQLMTIFMLTFIALAIISSLYIVYLNRAVFRPFTKLQSFASHVARGVLDLPLDMDKRNRFGAFTESFDLMREELAVARQREYEANRSKKELVASLSHDIKTPIASIKAVSELMLLQATDDKVIKQLNAIYAKADQVDYLVTDMFHATLEELQQLNVTVTEESSAILEELIEDVNVDQRIQRGPIPACIILADVRRLQQVLDNVISNSYKYAATTVSIDSRIYDTHLELHIMDYGCGVQEEELPLIMGKFYRGENAQGKNGSGLGLYLSQYFMEKMQGELDCYNRLDGFTVVLRLKLAA